MHSMIYFGFLVLLGVTTVLEIDHQLPEELKFLHGTAYQAYSFVGDAAGLVFLGGIVWAIIRRYVQRPYRIRIKSKPEHAAILATFFAVGVTGFGAEMFRIAEEGMPDYEKWSFIGYPLATLVDGWSADSLSTWHQWMWVVHVASFVAFLALLPLTMLRHIFTSPMNMYLKDKDRPKGAMRPMPNLRGDGGRRLRRLDHRGLHLEAAARPRRLHDVRSLHERVPQPRDRQAAQAREIVLKAGEVMAATGSPVVSPPLGVDSEITISANSLFERITPEEIWACTTCKACDEICPVNIEITDKIFDMRRYLSLMESNFPAEQLGNAYRAMENQSNPWGMNPRANMRFGPAHRRRHHRRRPAPPWPRSTCARSLARFRSTTDQGRPGHRRAPAHGIDMSILGPSEMCTATRSPLGDGTCSRCCAQPNIEMLNDGHREDDHAVPGPCSTPC